MTSMMQNMARVAGGVILAASFTAVSAPAQAGKKAPKPAPVAKADAPKLAPEEACIGEFVQAANGTVLHNKNGLSDQPMLPASTSKMMADLLYADAVRAEKIKLSDPIRFVPHVGYDICSLKDIKAKDKPVTGTVHDALMLFNVKSSNSAGFALQDYLEQKTGQTYAQLAAAKATKLELKTAVFPEATGMSNSTTCSGQKTGPAATFKAIVAKLAELGGFKLAIAATGSPKAPMQNMISPSDLAILTRTALSDSIVAPYLQQRSYTFAGTTYDKSDGFLRETPGVDGKSGSTRPAGGSLAFETKPDGTTVILMQCMPTGTIYNARHQRAGQIVDDLIPKWQNAVKFEQLPVAPQIVTEPDVPAEIDPPSRPALDQLVMKDTAPRPAVAASAPAAGL